MPIYTYRCSSCGVQFDQHQKFSDEPLTRCPECSKKALHKVFQPVGIVFKGSGFYATDHRSPSGNGRASAKSSESESSTSSDTTTSEPAKSSEKTAKPTVEKSAD